MSSHFGWVDFAEEDRQQILDILKVFAHPDTRDELGIGTVRDAFADYFFPGTTTVQTRARYFLIVPWVYQDASSRGRQRGWSPSELRHELDKLERSIIGALMRGEEDDGVIGGRAGRHVQRLPSSIYWPGLGALGIRLFPGSQSDLAHLLSRSFRKDRSSLETHASERDSVSEEDHGVIWHGSIPARPPGIFSQCTLALKADEARFLRERIRSEYPCSLFATFLRNDTRPLHYDFVWEHPLMDNLTRDLGRAVEDARRFSMLMRGAALLYNLMLAEKWHSVFGEDREEWRHKYHAYLEEWSKGMEAEWEHLRSWCANADQLWQSPGLQAWHSNRAEKDRGFIDQWFEYLSQSKLPVDIIKSNDARSLIRKRECNLKLTRRARLCNTDALRKWSGAAGTQQLDFRWGTARKIIRDIWDGIDSEKEGRC